MNNAPPLSEVSPSPSWSNWFQQIFSCLSGWKRSFNKTLTYDFGSISAHSQLSTTATVKGAVAGDAVAVTPLADTAGVLYTGCVTADDTVTIYAKNFTAGAIDPASTTFRIIVLQN